MKRLVIVLAACGDSTVLVQPVYDFPVDDPDATAIGLDTVTLAVAHEGNPADIVAQSFAPGVVVELANVPFADDLVVHLAGRVGAGDVAYGRTCSFAIAPDVAPPQPHLFFARNVKFASLGFTSARSGGVALTDAEGAAIVIGGDNLVAVERFDPRTATYTQITTVEARTGAVAAILGIGNTSQVALFGGTGASILELVASDGRYERIDDTQFSLARDELTATTLTDGRVVAIGGRNSVDAVTGTIAELRSEGGAIEIRELTTGLFTPRAGHTATRLGDDVGAPVLIAGGINLAGQPVAEAELFKPLSGDLSTTFSAMMLFPRSRHIARLLPDGSVLIIGGVNAANNPVRELERFTIDAGFVMAGMLPLGAAGVEMTATTLPDGRILLAGGRLTPLGAPIRDAFIARLDVINGAVDVIATDRLAEPRANHQATLLCDGTVLVTGGTDLATPAERYNPPLTDRR